MTDPNTTMPTLRGFTIVGEPVEPPLPGEWVPVDRVIWRRARLGDPELALGTVQPDDLMMRELRDDEEVPDGWNITVKPDPPESGT